MAVTAHAPQFAETEAVWRQFHGALLDYIRRRVRSREVAEDILQDVMLRIHRNAADIERADTLGAWLHTIARNAITDHYRSATVRRELAAGPDIDAAVDRAPQPEPEEPDARERLAACIGPLLERLPETYRAALAMTEVDGITQAQAAERLGVSLSGMKSRVQRGRKQLGQLLVRCCEVELDARRRVSTYQPRDGSCECGSDGDQAGSPGGVS